MRKAIKDNVMTEPEAQEMHKLCLESDQEMVEMPEHLHPVCQRLHLWEMPVPTLTLQ
jgi:hypothetical protein